jgi:hypothetical protein
MTLERAAPAFGLSLAALSRRERGQDRIQRADIQAAIKLYNLNQWEKFELWRAAGLIPDPQPSEEAERNWQPVVESTLQGVGYPALLVDRTGYIIAWNACMERLLWLHQFRDEPEPPYILDAMIFSERARVLNAENWETEARQGIAYWYHRTLFLAGDPTYAELLARLRQRHGDEFERIWQSIRESDHEFTPIAAGLQQIHVDYKTEHGPIRFVVMETPIPQAVGGSLTTFLPVGAESRTRYAQLCGDEPTDTRFLLGPEAD